MNNPAGRLFQLLEEVRKHSNQNASADTWSIIFELDGLPPAQRDVGVVRRLALLRAQLASLRQSLGAKAGGPRFVTHLERLEQLLNVRNLGLPWTVVREHAPDTTTEVLGSLAEVQPEEHEIATDTFGNLRTQVAATIEQVRTTPDLDDELRAFLLDQLHLMLDALTEYPWGGPETIGDAMDLAATRIVENAALLEVHGQNELVQEVWRLWQTLRSVGSTSLKLGMLATWLLVDAPDAVARLKSWTRLIPTQSSSEKGSPRVTPALPPTKPQIEDEDEGEGETPEAGAA